MKLLRAVAFIMLTLVTVTPPLTAKLEHLEPPDPAKGTIGLRLTNQYGIARESADIVYFVRVVEGADVPDDAPLIPSNFGKARNIYFLNAEPGRYAVVAAEVVRPPAQSRTVLLLAKEYYSQTEIEVKAGSVVFLGEIVVKSSPKSYEIDETQARNLNTIMKISTTLNVLDRSLGQKFAGPAVFKSVGRGDDVELEFWQEATHNHFRGEDAWVSFIEHRPVLRAPLAAPVKKPNP
jgi:hypothetical protein